MNHLELTKDLQLNRPVTTFQIRKEITLLEVINVLFIYRLLNNFTDSRKKAHRAVGFGNDSLPNIL